MIATLTQELWLVQSPEGTWELTRPWVTFQDGTGACGLVNAPLKKLAKGTWVDIRVADNPQAEQSCTCGDRHRPPMCF